MTGSEIDGALVAKGSPDLLVVLEAQGRNTPGWMQLAEDCATLTSKERPTVLVPVSRQAQIEISQAFYSRASRSGSTGLPCDGSILKVAIDRDERNADVLLRPEAPMFESAKGRASIQAYAGFLSYSGLACTVEHPDDSILYTTVEYATGDTAREQVLGWDDIYGADYPCALERIEIELLIQQGILTDGTKRRSLSLVLMQSRPIHLEYVWPNDGDDCILDADCEHTREQATLEKLTSLVQDELEELREDLKHLASTFKTDESGRLAVPTEQFTQYRRLVSRAKRHQEILAEQTAT